ncbi:MMPL family transporter [Sphingomonas sp. AP4-R1]|uniref:MMPL family transporter n=1 Tax=Sphingomonas sp. AP4-R1 TaxID=2735134 RepID=UPI0014938358|nr:MMPL family transporter [Sphingomonas sp. AP4-R1]QJU57520.1 MMPL family transporter [Sphingomonas sp. AP4-R1]
MMGAFVSRIVGWSIARPWRTLILALVLSALALTVALSRFAMSTDTADLISPTVAWRQQERATEAAFPQLSDTMLVVIDGKTPELAEEAAARLADRLTADRAHFRRVARPDGGAFFQKEGLLFGSREDVSRTTAALVDAQPLLGPLAADPSLRGVASAIGTVAEGASRDPRAYTQAGPALRSLSDTIEARLAGKPAYFSWQALFAGGNDALRPPTRRLLLLQPVLNHGDLEAGSAAADAVRSTAGSLGLDPAHGVTLRLTGEVPLADEEFATLQENIGFVGLVMALATLAALWAATRSPRLVAAILLTTTLGLLITAAIGLLAVGRFNLISIAFIPLFVGLGVDFGIQLSVRFRAERADGLDAPAAIAAAARALGPSLSLAAAATFLGFGAFLPTAYVGVAELGVIAGLGMIVALLLSVTLLPALILLFGGPAPSAATTLHRMEGADDWLARHRRAILIAFGVSLALSIVLLRWVSFDFNPLHLRDPKAPSMATLADLARDPDRTPNVIDALAPNHQTAQALAKKLDALPEVRQVVTLDSFVPEDQPAKLATINDAAMLLDLSLDPFSVAPAPGDDEIVTALRDAAAKLRSGPADAVRLANAFDRLAAATPASRADLQAVITRPLGIMLEQTRQALHPDAVTRATLPADLVRDWIAPDGRERIQLFPAGNASDNRVIHRFRDAVETVTPAISGLPVATQAAAETVAGAFVQAGVIAFLLVSLLLFAVLRDVREVAFTLAPVILSIFLTLGTCVLIGQPVNFANIIAFPLLFGVGVAFHIYFVMAWRGGETRLLGSSLARAVLFSALTTGVAFGSLWLSRHPGTASMGKILMISLIWTLICALIFEPALLGPPRQRRA